MLARLRLPEARPPRKLDEGQECLERPMTAGMSNYYREREAAERKAAERAAGPRERAIHLELAERYAQLALGLRDSRGNEVIVGDLTRTEGRFTAGNL